MLSPSEGLRWIVSTSEDKGAYLGRERDQGRILRTLGGLQVSQMWTGNPFFALLTRPVLGVILGVNWVMVGLWRGMGRCKFPRPIGDNEGGGP